MAAYSIVVVARDSPRLLLGCLAAVGAVARPDEVLVVDNGSTGELAGVLRLARVPARLLRLDAHGSLGRAYNAGLDAVTSPLALLLHADVLLETDPGPVATLLAGDPRIGVAGALLRDPDAAARGKLVAGWTLGVDRVRPCRRRAVLGDGRGGVSDVDAVSSAWMLVRRDDVRFDERFWFRLDDVDLCLQHRARGQRIVVGDAVAKHLEAGGVRERRAEPDWAAREVASRLLYHERWCATAAPSDPSRGEDAARDLARRTRDVTGMPLSVGSADVARA